MWHERGCGHVICITDILEIQMADSPASKGRIRGTQCIWHADPRYLPDNRCNCTLRTNLKRKTRYDANTWKLIDRRTWPRKGAWWRWRHRRVVNVLLQRHIKYAPAIIVLRNSSRTILDNVTAYQQTVNVYVSRDSEQRRWDHLTSRELARKRGRFAMRPYDIPVHLVGA